MKAPKPKVGRRRVNPIKERRKHWKAQLSSIKAASNRRDRKKP